jgi:hypothetical protein
MSTKPRFTTDFDLPVTALELPGMVVSGRDPAVRIVDGFARGIGIVGRFTASTGMLAVKVEAHGAAVRVETLVRLDAKAIQWWGRKVPADVQPRIPEGARLLLLHSQGALRAAALLSRRKWTRGPARAWLSFDLAGDELPDDGLLVFNLEEPVLDLPSWADGFSRHASVGIAVMRMQITPLAPQATAGRRSLSVLDAASSERSGMLSTGDLPAIDATGTRPLPTGAFLLNPPPCGLRPQEASSLVVQVEAHRATRIQSTLPYPLVRLLEGGPVGRGRRRVRRLGKRLRPLRAAAAREVRTELKMPKVPAAIEKKIRTWRSEPKGIIARLGKAEALSVEAVWLDSGMSMPVDYDFVGGRLVLRFAVAHIGPILVHVGVIADRAAPLLGNRPLNWQVREVRFAEAGKTGQPAGEVQGSP